MIFVRIILAVLLICFGIFASLGEDVKDFIFIEKFIPHWIAGSIILRFVPVAFFYSAFLILLHHQSILTRTLLIICIALLTFDLFVALFSKSPFGFLFFPNLDFKIAAFIWGVSAFMAITLLKSKQRFAKKLWIYLAIIPALGLSFIRPIYAPDWTIAYSTDLSISYAVADSLAKEANIILENDEPIVLAFFTASCPFCKICSSRFGVAHRKELLPQTLFLFPNTKEEITIFLSKTENYNAKFLSILNQDFFDFGGFTYPSVFLVEKDKSTHWIGGQVNNFAMHKMYKSKVK